MTDIVKALRDEIRRQARKEIRASLDKLQQAVSRQRREILQLKKSLTSATKRLTFLEQQERKRISATSTPPPTVRFSAKSVRSHRSRLGLSAAEYGQLVGVSGQTIYQWERGTNRPQKRQLATLVEVRKIGRKEARDRLRLLAARDDI